MLYLLLVTGLTSSTERGDANPPPTKDALGEGSVEDDTS